MAKYDKSASSNGIGSWGGQTKREAKVEMAGQKKNGFEVSAQADIRQGAVEKYDNSSCLTAQ